MTSRADQGAHTPGPWIVFHADADGANDVLPACRPGHIALDIKNGADARMIAALPDFFTAVYGDDGGIPGEPLQWLKILVSECRRSEVFAALAGDDPDACNTMLLECDLLIERASAAIAKAKGTA